jgi:hypothetical protein
MTAHQRTQQRRPVDDVQPALDDDQDVTRVVSDVRLVDILRRWMHQIAQSETVDDQHAREGAHETSMHAGDTPGAQL